MNKEKMGYVEMWLFWSLSEGLESEEGHDSGLGSEELLRLEFLAEHPELEDFVIWSLQESGGRRGGGAR